MLSTTQSEPNTQPVPTLQVPPTNATALNVEAPVYIPERINHQQQRGGGSGRGSSSNRGRSSSSTSTARNSAEDSSVRERNSRRSFPETDRRGRNASSTPLRTQSATVPVRILSRSEVEQPVPSSPSSETQATSSITTASAQQPPQRIVDNRTRRPDVRQENPRRIQQRDEDNRSDRYKSTSSVEPNERAPRQSQPPQQQIVRSRVDVGRPAANDRYASFNRGSRSSSSNDRASNGYYGRGGGGRGGGTRSGFASELSNRAYSSDSNESFDTPALSKDIKKDMDLTAKLIAQLTAGSYECMVCYEKVRKDDPIWSCRTCFAVFHLRCIRKWAKRSTDPIWRCPGCNTLNSHAPEQYTCFCGKVASPSFTAFVTPHSCGETCRKKREGTSCPHPCNMSCHPGPCPMCNVPVPPGKCFCGKEAFTRHCGESDENHSCGNTCGRLLDCQQHPCAEICHKGNCSPCGVLIDVACYGGHEVSARPCRTRLSRDEVTQGFYACAATCNKLLSCGNHKCPKPCHAGACGDCVLLPSAVTLCPCGAKPLANLLKQPRTSCLDPWPTCGSVCDKLLSCGHRCTSPCHVNACPPCAQLITVKCRCGAETAQLSCVQAKINEEKEPYAKYLCARVCRTLRNCGRHQCSRVCCAERLIDHQCPLLCGKKLQCGKHTCQLQCHRGHCERCLQASFDELACPCGRTVLYPPVPCGASLPACPHECSRVRACGHEAKHTCHVEGDCPPCMTFINKPCMCWRGIHVGTNCHKENPSCGRICERKLECGHKCTRVCHVAPCSPADFVCALECGRKRACGHLCKSRCHGENACPHVACKEWITISCVCGSRIDRVPCGYEGDHVPRRRQLECDEQCALEQRNKKLAVALDIHRPTPRRSEIAYQRSLFEFLLSNVPFVRKLEQTLDQFVRDSTKPVLHLPVMNRPQRYFVHTLVEHYRLDSMSVDQEPKRSIVLKKRIDTALPTRLLSEVYEDGTWMTLPPDDQKIGERADNDSSRAKLFAPQQAAAVPQKKFKDPVNAVRLQGLSANTSTVELAHLLNDFLRPVKFDVARLDMTTAAILPEAPRDDVTVSETDLIYIMDVLKKELSGLFETIDCCWVNANLEVVAPTKKDTQHRAAASIAKPFTPPTRNAFAVLEEDEQPPQQEQEEQHQAKPSSAVSFDDDTDDDDDDNKKQDNHHRRDASLPSTTTAAPPPPPPTTTTAASDVVQPTSWEELE